MNGHFGQPNRQTSLSSMTNSLGKLDEWTLWTDRSKKHNRYHGQIRKMDTLDRKTYTGLDSITDIMDKLEKWTLWTEDRQVWTA